MEHFRTLIVVQLVGECFRVHTIHTVVDLVCLVSGAFEMDLERMMEGTEAEVGIVAADRRIRIPECKIALAVVPPSHHGSEMVLLANTDPEKVVPSESWRRDVLTLRMNTDPHTVTAFFHRHPFNGGSQLCVTDSVGRKFNETELGFASILHQSKILENCWWNFKRLRIT